MVVKIAGESHVVPEPGFRWFVRLDQRSFLASGICKILRLYAAKGCIPYTVGRIKNSNPFAKKATQTQIPDTGCIVKKHEKHLKISFFRKWCPDLCPGFKE